MVTSDELPEVPPNVGPAPEEPTSADAAVASLEDPRQVTLPYPEPDYRCPACERPIPTRKQIRLAKPAKYDHLLNDIHKCPWCNFLFSPKVSTATVLQR